MENPTFFDKEDIPLINQDEDYDDYKTADTNRVDETSFTVPDTAKATSTLRLRQKLKRNKIQKQIILNCFFSMLIGIGNLSLINILVNF